MPEGQPSCCVRDDHIWDVVALYPEQAIFKTTSPTFTDGPVVRAEANMRPKLQDALP